MDERGGKDLTCIFSKCLNAWNLKIANAWLIIYLLLVLKGERTR